VVGFRVNADILEVGHGSYVPIAALSIRSNVRVRTLDLFDHLVGASDQRG